MGGLPVGQSTAMSLFVYSPFEPVFHTRVSTPAESLLGRPSRACAAALIWGQSAITASAAAGLPMTLGRHFSDQIRGRSPSSAFSAFPALLKRETPYIRIPTDMQISQMKRVKVALRSNAASPKPHKAAMHATEPRISCGSQV